MADTSSSSCCGPRVTLRAVVLIVIALFLGSLVYLQQSVTSSPDASVYIAPDSYQAIFLENGQVYFGKLVDGKNDYFVLNDIYYLQRTSPLQGEDAVTGNDLSLIKLGNELHGPQDAMYIPKASVLFFENLKNDSRVVMAIREYKG